MTEERFWQLVKINCPYGKYWAASITCRGGDYFEESNIDDGPQLAKKRLRDKLVKLGYLTDLF